MVSVEFITEKAMGIITYAGMAKSSYMEALGFAKQEKFSESDDKLKEGSRYIVESHHIHARSSAERDVLRRTSGISLLMAHAEDQLMGAEMLKLVIMELIELHKDK